MGWQYRKHLTCNPTPTDCSSADILGAKDIQTVGDFMFRAMVREEKTKSKKEDERESENKNENEIEQETETIIDKSKLFSLTGTHQIEVWRFRL